MTWQNAASAMRRTVQCFTRHISWGTWVVLLMQVGWLAALTEHKIIRLHQEPNLLVSLVVTFVALLCASESLNLLFTRGRWSSLLVNSLVVVVCTVLAAFHFITRSRLDYDLVRTNWNELFCMEAVHLVLAGPGSLVLGCLAAGWIATVVLEIGTRILPVTSYATGRWPRLAVCLSAWMVVVVSNARVLDELTFLTQSAYHFNDIPQWNINTQALENRGIHVDERFSLVHAPVATTVEAGPRPNVIMLVMESFNANFLGARSPEGAEYTPALNSLRKQTVVAQHFWGNSVQSAKGQVALLCSTLPAIKGKITTDFPDTNLRCLANVLKDHGYQTHYYTAGRYLDFDAFDTFWPRHGFEVVRAMPEDQLTPEERRHTWGWGLQDDRFYRRVLRELDQTPADKPVFAVVANISNHQPFSQMPGPLRKVYRTAANPVQHYANSIHFADESVRVFLAGLRKSPRLSRSLIIVVGDHSYPVNEHGYMHNEVGSNDETFRTVFMMGWAGRLNPRELKGTFSQVDVAPTVTALLGIQEQTHWMGQDMLEEQPARPRVAHLVQPYDGTHLVTLSYPFKFVHHVRSNRSFLYNLQSDPHEDRNLLVQQREDPVVRMLEQEMSLLFFNQRLIVENRIWPPTSGAR